MATPSGITETRQAPLLARILRQPPHYAFLVAMLAGFGLIAGSMILNIDSFNTPKGISLSGDITIERQAGYIWAWNWSVTYTVLFPLALYFGLLSLRYIRDSLRELHAQGMVRTAAMAVIDNPTLRDSWIKGDSVRRALIVVFAVVVPFGISAYEWATNNLLRLFESPLAPAASVPDYDWGLKALMFHQSTAARLANASFDLASFSMEGLLLGFSLAYFLLLLDLGRVIPLGIGDQEDSKDAGSMRLVPNLKSLDKRAGFELFEEPLLQMLFVALIMYLMFYLVRIEGAYLHGTGSVSNLTEFIQKDILAGASAQQGDSKGDPKQGDSKGDSKDDSKGGDWKSALKANMAHLLDPGDMDVRAFLSQTAVFLIFILCGIVIVMTVRIACERAIANATSHLDKCGSCTLFEVEDKEVEGKHDEERNRLQKTKHDEERNRLQKITSWPLGYIKPNLLFLAMAFAVVSLYYYRIGLYVAGFVIAALLVRVLMRVQKWGRN